MRRNAFSRAMVLASAALSAACSDPSTPTVPTTQLASEPSVSLRGSSCRPPTPDNQIPLPIAPPSKRIDLFTPVFSRSTSVTNPLFPISNLSQAILVGAADGEPLRIETTLMPKTLRVRVGNGSVETLASQFVAYVGRRIHEYALDRYAQADDGSVWYFGEDVFNYEDGEIADTEGTWLACKDGPAAMIMAANPRVGDVFRTENAFPIVFEEVTVQIVGQTVQGPRGPVTGAVTMQEMHMDGSLEKKVFAPGYGEFGSGAFPDFEAMALAVPTDALPGGTPSDLRALTSGARRLFQLAAKHDWGAASQLASGMNAAWGRQKTNHVPPLLEPLMTAALTDVTQSVSQQRIAETHQAAVDVLRVGLDLELQFRSRVEIDGERLDLWLRQLVIDAKAHDSAGIASDLAILKWILDRLDNVGSNEAQRDAHDVAQQLSGIGAAVKRGDFKRVVERARRLLDEPDEDD